MDAGNKIGLAILILLLLPAMVAEWEARRLSDGFYAAIAAGGALYASATGGMPAVGWALFAGFFYLALLTAIIAIVLSVWDKRLLTGGHIKMLSAGALWLGFEYSAAMLAIAIVAIVSIAMWSRIVSHRATRPATAVITALSILVTFAGSGLVNAVS